MNLVVFDTDTTGATISINAPSSTIGSDEFTVTGQASASEAGNIVYLEAPDYAVPNSPYTDVVGYGTIRGDGSWQVTAFVTADGNYSFEAVVVAANGQQTASAAQSFVVQTAPANGVSITDGGATITGSSYDLTGLSSVAAGYIEIELGNGEYTLVQTDNSGNWSYDLPVGSGPGYLNGSDNFSPVVISPGLNSVTVSLAYDQNFNPISGTEATTTLTVVPPEPVPVITSATTDQGQVISSGEAITDPHVTFAGTAEDNSTVTIFDENDDVVGTVTADGSGNWTYDDTSVTLSTGDNYFSATSVDFRRHHRKFHHRLRLHRLRRRRQRACRAHSSAGLGFIRRPEHHRRQCGDGDREHTGRQHARDRSAVRHGWDASRASDHERARRLQHHHAKPRAGRARADGRCHQSLQ